MNVEGNKRAKLIGMLNDFVYQYGDCKILITCRVAAVDYSFTQFDYVEMADFDVEQIGRYIGQWFVDDEVKCRNCRQALLKHAKNKAVLELAQVPLLLSLLCLVYEERNEFPPQRDEIYEEATRALLSKWDASRNIVRDTVYPQLSLKEKQRLLAYIAAETFPDGEYFLPENKVVGLIEAYLQGVPGVEDPDGELVLKTMEAQHGILVERANRIHSFSHLTLQEYFTARYIVENESRGAVDSLMRYVGDDRWDEVFLLTAGMLTDASEFFQHYLEAAWSMVADDVELMSLLAWVEQKQQQVATRYKPAAVRAFIIFTIFGDDERSLPLALHFDREIDREIGSDIDIDLDIDDDYTLESEGMLDYGSAYEVTIRALTVARLLDGELNRAYELTRSAHTFEALFSIVAESTTIEVEYDFVDIFGKMLKRATLVAAKMGREEFLSELEGLSRPANEQETSVWEGFGAELMQVMEKYADLWNPIRQITVEEKPARDLVNGQRKRLASYLAACRRRPLPFSIGKNDVNLAT